MMESHLLHLVTLHIMLVGHVICHVTNVTCNFIAPEVLGPEMYDLSCDMWSIGVIMYIL